jgi:hypothetical protein
VERALVFLAPPPFLLSFLLSSPPSSPCPSFPLLSRGELDVHVPLSVSPGPGLEEV